MKRAAVTYVYNEAVNLKIWVAYYGRLFGHNNLFVIDRGSDDGSTSDLGDANILKVPKRQFDEHEKTNAMSAFHRFLTSFYDFVIVTDADEMVAPDPIRYTDLNDYLDRLSFDYVSAVGIDVVHIINRELPLDFNLPIMSQRKYGRFHSPECKILVSRHPIEWLPGLHSSNKLPRFDKDLFIFHLKIVDFSTALRRQVINIATDWSASSLAANYGTHHRFSIDEFVHTYFLSCVDLVNRDLAGEFAFEDVLAEIVGRTVRDARGFYHIPMDVAKMVTIPSRFMQLF